MVSAASIDEPGPRISVVRHSFFPLPGGERSGHLRWVESSPPDPQDHDVSCGCTRDVSERPSGDPFDVRQEVRASWPECSIAIEEGICEPWVTFREAGDVEEWRRRRAHGKREDDDRSHAYFIFDARQSSVKIEVASTSIPLTGVLLTSVLVGNQIDVSRMLDGCHPSEVVRLADISPEQVWLHAAPWLDAMRVLRSPEESTALRKVMTLAADVRRAGLPRARALDAGVDEVRGEAERDHSLVQAAADLRRALTPFAFGVEHTELFERAREMYTQEVQARWPRPQGPRRSPASTRSKLRPVR